MFIPKSLVQHDKKDSSQDGTQSLTTWPLPSFCCTYQPLLSCMHLKTSIPTSRRPICWKIRILLVRSIPRGPTQDLDTRAHPSILHRKCILLLRYYLYLDPTWWRQHHIPFMPIDIHWIFCSSIFSPHSKQGSQHDSLFFRITNWLNSYR